MSRLARLFLVLALTLLPLAGSSVGRPDKAEAHPLGNFTINRLASLQLSSSGATVRYVIDMAEIPAFQEIRSIDANGDGDLADAETSSYLTRVTPDLIDGLNLTVAGQRLPLSVVAQSIIFPDGQGGLKTLRLALDLQASIAGGWQDGVDATLTDSNYADRLGWKEIVVQAGSGVALTQSSAATLDDTAELTTYPSDRLKSPPSVPAARFRFEAGDPSTQPAVIAAPAAGQSEAAPGRSGSGFANLIAEQELTLAFVALSLLAAFAWGAAHALGPGHGKTIVAAYLVGSRGTARHAMLLGLTVTITHTSTVIALGLGTLYASRFFATEDLYLWLSVASGLLVVVMGAALFFSRLNRVLHGRMILRLPSAPDHWHGEHDHDQAHTHEGHSHSHSRRLQVHRRAATQANSHDHDLEHHGHSHEVTRPGWQGLVLLGISGGLLPCPTALVVMLSAIALDRVAYGLVLILSFSVGLASVLIGIGILLVYAGDMLGKSGSLSRLFASPLSRRVMQAAPLLSALAILAVGLVLTNRALTAI